MDEADRNERTILRLELEGRLNAHLEIFKESIRNLIRGIKSREIKGLTMAERQEIYCQFLLLLKPTWGQFRQQNGPKPRMAS